MLYSICPNYRCDSNVPFSRQALLLCPNYRCDSNVPFSRHVLLYLSKTTGVTTIHLSLVMLYYICPNCKCDSPWYGLRGWLTAFKKRKEKKILTALDPPLILLEILRLSKLSVWRHCLLLPPRLTTPLQTVTVTSVGSSFHDAQSFYLIFCYDGTMPTFGSRSPSNPRTHRQSIYTCTATRFTGDRQRQLQPTTISGSAFV